jgi:O-acetyl-ADP-ribose deacetylase (regulator of RNase III)
MRELTICNGDATAPLTGGEKIIVHVCNDIGGWGKGFVTAVSKRWPEPERAYRAWYAARATSGFRLGAMQLVRVANDLQVANVIGQHGIRSAGGQPPVRYEAIEEGLRAVAAAARELTATVHMPRIGCGLAGGRWEAVEPIITRTLAANDIAVFVYDFAASR